MVSKMKYFSQLFLCFITVSFACNTTSKPPENKIYKKDSLPFSEVNPDRIQVAEGDTLVQPTATYYIVVVDTSEEYFFLQNKMYNIHEQIKIPIDTMGRYFNAAKNLIILPESDEDEIYAGEYFPQRFPTNCLSLEYLNSYDLKAREKSIALVAGIFEKEQAANSLLYKVKNRYPNSFKIKSTMYTGCVH